jgi:hypothetical protein
MICKTCEGHGAVVNDALDLTSCPACRGTGYSLDAPPAERIVVQASWILEARHDRLVRRYAEYPLRFVLGFDPTPWQQRVLDNVIASGWNATRVRM